MKKIVIHVVLSIIALYVLVMWFSTREREIHTRMFCAYDRVFVEFVEGSNTWGTMWVDNNGKPIPCKEGAEIAEPIKDVHKEII